MPALNLPELFIIRHAETVWNAEGRMQGRFDSELSAKGHAQSLAVGDLLRRAGVGQKTHRWISSPQGRAVETARLACGDGALIETDARLSEIGMGEWAGLDRAEIAARWPGPDQEDMIAFYARIPGGESFASLEARITAFLTTLTMPTVIVTHGMTSRFLRMIALGLTREDLLHLPGGQGVVHHLRDGVADVIGENGTADGLRRPDARYIQPV